MEISKLTKKRIEEIEKSRVEDIKKQTAPIDGQPLVEFIVEKGDTLTKEEKQQFVNSIKKSADRVGEMLLDRAFIEKVMTEEEYKDINKKYDMFPSDFGTILQAYFNRKDGEIPKDGKLVVVTMENTNIFKNRDFIKKRFNVNIFSCKEAVEIMEKEVESKSIQKSQ